MRILPVLTRLGFVLFLIAGLWTPSALAATFTLEPLETGLVSSATSWYRPDFAFYRYPDVKGAYGGSDAWIYRRFTVWTDFRADGLLVGTRLDGQHVSLDFQFPMNLMRMEWRVPTPEFRRYALVGGELYEIPGFTPGGSTPGDLSPSLIGQPGSVGSVTPPPSLTPGVLATSAAWGEVMYTVPRSLAVILYTDDPTATTPGFSSSTGGCCSYTGQAQFDDNGLAGFAQSDTERLTESYDAHVDLLLPATGYTVTGAAVRLTGFPIMPVAVPEPGTLLLLGLGLAGLIGVRRLRTRAGSPPA